MTRILPYAFILIAFLAGKHFEHEHLKSDSFLRQAIHAAYQEGRESILIEVIDNEIYEVASR